jgi:hypothetical protein
MKGTRALVVALVALLTVGICGGAVAAPNEIHTQGILRDANGDLMEGEVALTFRIFDSSAEGQMLWEEAVTLTVMGGVFDVLLPADPDNFPFPADLFAEDGRWLSITPADQGELPRIALVSVPYALQAGLAGNLECSGCIGSDEVDFNFAASDAPGGAATSALTANEALVANNVACVGCVTLEAVDAAVLTAANVSYDNALTGLAAVTVQDAIDEAVTKLDQHAADMELHGSGGAGDGGAKVRVVAADATVVSGQVATEYLHVFSSDTPKVYLYLYGLEASEGDGVVLSTGGGTLFYTRCPWSGNHGKHVNTCTPPACPQGWSDLGVTGNAKVSSAATGASSGISDGSYTTSSGYQERACFHSADYAVLQPKCGWTGSHAKHVNTCTPPDCPQGWSDLGVTGNLRMSGTGTGASSGISDGSYTTSSGYQERTCINQVKSEIPQGVRIWVDGVDRTAAIGDQQAKGAPDWTGSAWGADGTTPWATGRLDISQVIDWGVGEHILQLKNTGESGGKLKYYVYFVAPAAQSVAFPNDDCGGAEALVFNGGIAKVDATTEDMLGENKALDHLSPAGCGGEGGGDVVYSATITERTTIKASVKAPFATRLYVLDSPCANETVLACGTTSATTAELDPGTYYIVVDSDAAEQTGDFALTVELEASPLPTNDTCDTLQAIDAGPNPIQVTGTTKWGLDQYKGTCGGDGVADLQLTIDAAFASVLVLRAQNCAGGFQLSCSTSGTLSVQGLAPGTYYLFVDGVTVEDEGPFTLNVTLN